MTRKYSKQFSLDTAHRKPLLTALDRAGTLLARWRTVWGSWVDHWAEYQPGKKMAEVHADVPGLLTRLSLAQNVADVIVEAENEARRAAYLRVLQHLEVDRLADKKSCQLPRCPTVAQLAGGIRELMRKEGL